MDEQAAVCFKLVFFILTLSLVHTSPCPYLPLWDAHAKTFCKDPSWYHCLENQAGNIKEICITPKYISKGHYPVIFIGGQELGERSCPSSHYQPNGQMSNQYKSVTCMYMKDLCSDDGEEPCDDGSDVSDRMCRCDYTRGYIASEYLLSNPQLKSCYQPKSEITGCIMLQCEKGKELNKAYQCVPACSPGYYKPHNESRCFPDLSVVNSSTSTESMTTQTQMEKSMEKEVSGMKDQVSNDNPTVLAVAISLSLLSVLFSAAVIIVLRSKQFLKAFQRCRLRHGSDKSSFLSSEELKERKSGEKHHKILDNAYRYADLDAIHKQDIGKRIGCIKLTSPTGEEEYGTGFRVGERYVMTAYHVVQGMYDRFWNYVLGRIGNSAVQPEEGPSSLTDTIKCLDSNIQEIVKKVGMDMVTESSHIRFGYFNDKQTGTTFRFKCDVPFVSKKYDIAILEMEVIEDSSKPWPPSIDLASVYVPNMLLHILGHPGGRELQTDPACKIIIDESELKNTITNSIKFFSSLTNEITIDWRDFSKCEISPDQILFHCSKSTAHGASGSPLIRNVNDHPEVIGMLLEGYPKIYYNKFRNNKKANERPDLLIESGISMEKVKSLLQEHNLTELSNNIFNQEF